MNKSTLSWPNKSDFKYLQFVLLDISQVIEVNAWKLVVLHELQRSVKLQTHSS